MGNERPPKSGRKEKQKEEGFIQREKQESEPHLNTFLVDEE
jgi:hypothetical protein